MYPTEFRSHIHWQAAQRGDERLTMPVLFFERETPTGFEESGLYLGFEDFKDVQRDMGIEDVPLTTLYHNLVLYFSAVDKRLHQQAEKHLRYNPDNCSSWNRYAWTYSYYLFANELQDYASYNVPAELKIPGVGYVGRRVMRAVLFDDVCDELG